MADTVTANPGIGGAVFATDDIGGVHYPRVKATWGADGSANDTSAANPMPVVQTGALPAGTNAIGKLSANSGVDIGDVDITSIAAGDNNIGNVDIASALPAGNNNIGDVDVASIAAGNNNIGDVDIASFAAGAIVEVQGDVADDAAIAGNPVTIGLHARTADRTAVATGDAVRALGDTQGKQVVLQGSVHELHVDDRLNLVNDTAANIINAPGAGRKVAVQSILVINSHATVGTKVEIRRATTVKLIGFAAANGGGFSYSAGGSPLFYGGDNEAITGRCTVTGSNVDIFVTGYTIPV